MADLDDIPEGSRWLTMADAAHHFRISERTLRRRIEAGQWRTHRDGGRVLVLVHNLADTVADKSATAATSDTGTAEADKWWAEVEKWRTLAEEREKTIRELWDALAREQVANMANAANVQKLIEGEKGPSLQAGEADADQGRLELGKRRRWWEFWKG
jgi:hypothetical protein